MANNNTEKCVIKTLMMSCDSRASVGFLLESSASDLTLLLLVDLALEQQKINILPSVMETMTTAENHAWKRRAGEHK